MRKDYEKLFTHLKKVEPVPELFGQIMDRIHKEQNLAVIQRRFIFFSMGLAISIAAFIPAFKMVRAGFIESGFAEYFLLLFSDSEIIAVHWQDYVLSLLESLPVMSLIIFSAVTLLFLESLKLLAKDITTILSSKKLTANIYGHK